MIAFLRKALSETLSPKPDAWTDFQAAVRAEKKAAQAKHGRVRDVEARQRATVHAALRRVQS